VVAVGLVCCGSTAVGLLMEDDEGQALPTVLAKALGEFVTALRPDKARLPPQCPAAGWTISVNGYPRHVSPYD
jgi:hypothetical protein